MTAHVEPSQKGGLDRGAELEAVLRALVEVHEKMLSLTAEHRQAIATADARALGACIGREVDLARAAGELEEKRRGIARAIIGGPAADKATIAMLVERLRDPARGRVLEEASRLKAVLAALAREHGVIRQATLSLSAHMEGMMRQVARLSHSGTYGRAGCVVVGASVSSALDIRR